MTFSLNKSINIYIYGAGALGVNLATYAETKGYKIAAFLDRNAADIRKINDISVLSLEEFQFCNVNDTVVIIALQNVTQHESIVKRILQNGCNKVIYFPVHTFGMSPVFVSNMRKKYNECITYKFEYVLENIPQMDIRPWNYDSLLAGNVLWMPIEVCFAVKKTVSDRQSDYTIKAEELLDKYVRGKNIYCILPYWQLFEYLEGDKEDCELYLKIYGRRGHISNFQKTDSELLKDRNALLSIYLYELNMHSDFFYESPCEVEIGRYGKVYILDGIHRGVFLAKKGYRWLPVKILKNDTEFYINKSILQRIKKYVNTNNIQQIEFPIEHPAFYGFPVHRDDVINTWKEIVRYVEEKNITKNMCVDFSDTGGYFARNLLRIGFKLVYLKEIKNDFDRMIKELFGFNEINEINSIGNVIMQSNLVILSWQEVLKFNWNVDKECSKALVCIIDIPSCEMNKFKNAEKKSQALYQYCVDGEKKYMVFIGNCETREARS